MSRALTAWGVERARYVRTNCGGLYPASIKRYERFLSVSLPLLCHSARISSLINHTEADGRSLLAASSRFCLSVSVESRATFTCPTEHELLQSRNRNDLKEKFNILGNVFIQPAAAVASMCDSPKHQIWKCRPADSEHNTARLQPTCPEDETVGRHHTCVTSSSLSPCVHLLLVPSLV